MSLNSKPTISARRRAVLRYIWQLDTDEVKSLDLHFLLFQSGKEFLADCYLRTEKMYITHEKMEYEVIFDDTPSRCNTDNDLGLSFRCNRNSNFAVVLVKIWKFNTDMKRRSA